MIKSGQGRDLAVGYLSSVGERGVPPRGHTEATALYSVFGLSHFWALAAQDGFNMAQHRPK